VTVELFYTGGMSTWPVSIEDVREARERLRPYLSPTGLRHYAELDAALGNDLRVLVKHENHQPTNAFKARNALAVMTRMSEQDKRRGVIAATRGNHGQGVAWAGRLLGVPVTICVPRGNNPEKNAAMRGFGAELIEDGRDYDESLEVATRLVAERGLRMVHSTNDPMVIAGAATITLEILEQAEASGESLDAMVVAVGGGSQAVGALTVTRALRPDLPVYGVQAANASAIHDSWHAGAPLARNSADTFADGLATRSCYELTFAPLREGLRDFVKVTEAEIAEAVRIYLRTTHNLAEGAGAAGLAGLCHLAEKPASELAGKTVAVILSGSNIDEVTLRRVINREL
jgi:threonine dehydratase